MAAGYGQEQVPQGQQQGQLSATTQQDAYYADDGGYGYAGDMWAGRKSTDQAAQVREALFGMKLPSESDFEEWFPALSSAIDLVARIPGFDTAIYAELNRDMEDLVDRASSQGRRRIIASKMQKFIFKLRSLVPKGDVPVAGVTGVTAMITTNTNSKQEIRMPMQQAPGSIFDGASRWLRGR